ncbi:double zinc ribbon domain-containing protein [Gilvimarinus agarilyticus]|uniref:double zinc ribbon domain-containing protein n=1 Tax=Gilvimarinus agarilyticus TaxID=679259 RepID=UPI0005A2C1DF|nr:double zinc ribbon domain-containing protein [Gilvimarinus agarilyticus]
MRLPRFSLCLLCHQSADEILCAGCTAQLRALMIGEHQCRQCALPLDTDIEYCGECLAMPPAFDRVVTPCVYAHPLDYLIGRAKHHHCLRSARVLSELMQCHIQQYYRVLPQREWPTKVVAVPLHWRRHISRGFNQTHPLARAGARAIGLPLSRKLLKRIRATEPQQGLTRRQRLENLHGAFVAGDLKGQRVALVDDVVTTTTTAREISKVLRRAGAAEVHIWALARTPANG